MKNGAIKVKVVLLQATHIIMCETVKLYLIIYKLATCEHGLFNFTMYNLTKVNILYIYYFCFRGNYCSRTKVGAVGEKQI